jgi:hypothetical protein
MFSSPAMRLTQEWLYSQRNVDLREALRASRRPQTFGWLVIGVRHFRRRSPGMHTASVCSWWENLSAPSHVRPDTTYDQKFTSRYHNIVNCPVRCSQCYRCSCLGGTDRRDERLFLIKCFGSIKYIKLLKEGVST